jgi:hypothetical protein
MRMFADSLKVDGARLRVAYRPILASRTTQAFRSTVQSMQFGRNPAVAQSVLIVLRRIEIAE